ncbi:hypothetical protein M3210_17200 [Oceanobacillus luteolus]|uniref:Uncharacterized protein n=1 Tax=Oceanobacillus luteolus TaxID=1274358 RepID=A0ABW4HTE5_9BACI|nr:hypothetical protein [Oceanobacillus luteolus]MCM3741990.1 hypothetical protein [Oceanobacillus luteolus]
MSKKDIPKELNDRLAEFKVEVPEIPLKRSKMERFANWIYAPAKDPLEALGIKENSLPKLIGYPFVILLILFAMPILFI